MTASHQRPGGGDGPFGNLANRGVIIVVVAVVVGFVLLSQGFGDRDGETAAAPPETTTTTEPASSTTVAPTDSTNTDGGTDEGTDGSETPQTTVVEGIGFSRRLEAKAQITPRSSAGSSIRIPPAILRNIS
jgi:hypothetical protein